MFYASNDIDIHLSCAYCNERFGDVIKTLKCGEAICGQCYIELKKDCHFAFTCKACFSIHIMYENGLPDAKNLANIAKVKRIKVEKPLSNEAETLKKLLSDVHNHLNHMESFDGKSLINESCDKLESDIKRACGLAKDKFIEIESNLIKEVNEYR